MAVYEDLSNRVTCKTAHFRGAECECCDRTERQKYHGIDAEEATQTFTCRLSLDGWTLDEQDRLICPDCAQLHYIGGQ